MKELRRRPPEAAVVRGADKLRWLARPVALLPGSPVVVVAIDVSLLEIPAWLRTELGEAS
jgi:hypothetical protein